jgi:TRAP-type C4-dicarboxylate transport system permease small subunit
MSSALHVFRRLLQTIGYIERALGVALIALIVTTITTQVFTRYALNRPIIWVEELAMYSFIWAALIGASLGLKHGRHIRIETFVGHLSPQAQHACRILTNLIIIAILWSLLKEIGKVVAIESRSTSVSLPIPVPRAWFYSIPMLVACNSMVLTCVYYVLSELAALGGGSPYRQSAAVFDPPPPNETLI